MTSIEQDQEAARTEAICREAIERLLAAMSKTQGSDGLRASFFYGPPRAAIYDRRFGIEIFYSRQGIVEAALFVRANGPPHLRQMAVQDVQRMLTTFVVENFWQIGNEVMFADVPGSFAASVSWQTKNVMTGLLASSSIFKPASELTIYPLVPVRVEDDFESTAFSFIRPASLTHVWLGIHPRNSLVPDRFSPFREDAHRELVTSWLGVSAPTFQLAEKRKGVILGALALTLPRHERKLFSGRHNFGGRCTFSSQVTESFGEPSVPPLMHDATVGAKDHRWLTLLAQKVISEANTDVKHCRALEYFYRAWPLRPNESISHLFMSLDSIFGDASAATQVVIDALAKHGGTAFPYERLRLLLGLRNSVLHGGAPDVHDSTKYHRYYETYGADPIVDIELIAAQCFRAVIFDGLLEERSSTSSPRSSH
jgi:hypothetical protein